MVENSFSEGWQGSEQVRFQEAATLARGQLLRELGETKVQYWSCRQYGKEGGRRLQCRAREVEDVGLQGEMQQSQPGARGSTSTNGSTSTCNSASSRRRPHVWQDDMAEVKETFRRVARARLRQRKGSYDSPPRVTAPTLSRNRRARIRCQVPSGGLQVPVKILQEMQGNRSQSPFVSLNHLQNVLGMCRRIRSQQSLTERKKNPHDSSVHPVYVRRPWTSVSSYPKGSHVNTSSTQASPTSPGFSPPSRHSHAHVSPTSQHHLSSASQSVTSQSAEAVSLPHDVNPSTLFRSSRVTSNCRQRATAQVSHGCLAARSHISPNDRTPLYYRPVRFKALYDISNGVFPHNQMRKRDCCSLRQLEKARMCAKEKPSCTHYSRELISHSSHVDDTLGMQHVVNPNQHADHNHPPNPSLNMQSQASNIHLNASSLYFHSSVRNTAAGGTAHHRSPWQSLEDENFIITKKARTLRPSPMLGFSESWPNSSSSCFSNDHQQCHLSGLQAHLKLLEQGLDCSEYLDSDRRPHSENDLNLHSVSYFSERPPSRCMKRPLSSSCPWRNVGHDWQQQLGMPIKSLQSPLDFGFADAWSASSSISQQDCSIFIPRDLNGNILKPLSSSPASKGTSTMRFEQRYCPKSKSNNNAGYKSTSFAGALMEISRRHKAGPDGQKLHRGKQHSSSNYNTHLASKASICAATKTSSTGLGNPMQESSYGGEMKKKKKEKKPINFSSTSCLDDLEGLPPSKWAKRLASDLMGTTAYGTKLSKAGDHMSQKACLSNGYKHRVKFASTSVQISNAMSDEGFRKEAQSLASTEINIPDLLSWERDSGLLTGDPPSVAEDADDEEPDQQLLEQVEAMLAASSSSSTSGSPSPASPYSQLISSPSPMTSMFYSPAHVESSWYSKSPSQMRPHRSAADLASKCEKAVHHHDLEESKSDASRSFHKENGTFQLQPMGDHHEYSEDQQLQAGGDRQACEALDLALAEAENGSRIVEEMSSKEAIEAEPEMTEQEINNDAIDAEQEEDAIKVEPEMNMTEQAAEKVNIEPHELNSVDNLISIHHNTVLIEAMESKSRNGVDWKDQLQVQLQQEEEDDKETKAKAVNAATCNSNETDDDDQWELEKLFQDSLDLNPTLRHIYDSMSFHNSRVYPDQPASSFTIS
ncbi:hypothetical protein L7F22_015769 [Adiantum nelumboides]|nr:hypothetical protein [Adiantum nelumboides]